MPTCRKCSADFPNWVTIDGRWRNLHTRTSCLNCAPFGQRNRKRAIIENEGARRCPRCQRVLDLAYFYSRRDGGTFSTYCIPCSKQLVVERQQELKRLAVEYKGGRCAHCGYNRYLGSLEFHHIDPVAKEFSLSHYSGTAFEKVKGELDKCVLLCSNCHREEHARIKGLLRNEQRPRPVAWPFVKWSGRRESNPRLELGRLSLYH